MQVFLQDFFEGYGYVLIRGNEAPEAATTTFSQKWHETYFSESFQEIDPVFHFARANPKRSTSTVFGDDQMAGSLFEEAKLHGADSNFACISHLGGSTMVFGGVNRDLGEVHREAAEHSCRVEHRRALIGRIVTLRDSQLDLLDLAEEGLLDKELSAELGITHSALQQRKKSICAHVGTISFRTTLNLYSLHKWQGIVPQ